MIKYVYIYTTEAFMSDKNTLFKSALGGYNKSDVNNYITAVSAELKAKEELYSMQKSRLEKELEIEKESKKLVSEQLDELGFELFSAQSELASANLRETELKNSVMGLSERVAELEQALAIKTSEAEQSSEELDKIGEMIGVTSDDDEMDLTQKAALYDKLSDRIGEIMLKADSDAEQIMTGAMERSEEIISDAQKQADDILNSAEKEAQRIRDRYKKAAGNYYEEVAIFVSEIKEHLESFVREIGTKSNELEHKIEYMQLPGAPAQEKEIRAECKEKSAQEKSKSENRDKKSYSAIDEKIENFFKSTMAAINAFRSK